MAFAGAMFLSSNLHQTLRVLAGYVPYTQGMEMNTQNAPENQDAAMPQGTVEPRRSHTQAHPVTAPHTKAGLSTISSPEPYIRIFLLAWAVRYIPRGVLGELFDSGTFRRIKEPMNEFIGNNFLKRHLERIGKVIAENKELVQAVRADETLLEKGKSGQTLYEKMRAATDHWRGDASEQVPFIIKGLKEGKDGVLEISRRSEDMLRKTIRRRLYDMCYSTALFIGSTTLTLKYSALVREDIKNLFSETVALEKGIAPEDVRFSDIARSENKIIRHTIENYQSKRNWRLVSDSAFLLTAPLKSMHITDALLGLKGWQMFRDTQHRTPTVFEDLITFVNNKINPVNGLGQPVNMGEVFDLYQHYERAYAPQRAFVGVIEHEQSEGARWADNQLIFQRMTELLNKTYAYKHTSIVDKDTGLTALQADFALPKFMYLLGHDLIDVYDPQKTLITVEIANSHGIHAVKDMQKMLAEGKTLDAVTKRYPIAIPTPARQEMSNDVNGVIAKGSSTQIDAAVPQADSQLQRSQPLAKIDAASLHGHTTTAQAPKNVIA